MKFIYLYCVVFLLSILYPVVDGISQAKPVSMSQQNGTLKVDSVVIDLDQDITESVISFSEWVKPFESRIKFLEGQAKDLAGQIRERSSGLNGQITGLLKAKGIKVLEESPYRLLEDNKTVTVPQKEDTITIELPKDLVQEIEEFQVWSKPIQGKIQTLEFQAKEINWQIREKSSGVNGQIKGYLRGKAIDLKDKVYNLSPDGKKVTITPEPKKE